MDKRFDEIIREIGIFLIFLFFLYFVSFSNLSNSSFISNQLFQSIFVDQQNPNEKGLNNVKKFIIFIINFKKSTKFKKRSLLLMIFGLGQ